MPTKVGKEILTYLTVDEIILINRAVMQKYGGVSRIRDRGALESCAAQPGMVVFGYERFSSLSEKAAAYCFFISQNQPFQDGNKRTGFACAIRFLHLHTSLAHINEISAFNVITAVARKEATIEDLVNLFETALATTNASEDHR